MTDEAGEQAIARLYRASPTPALVDVPELSFLMIDGHGDPNTSEDYQTAVGALYAVSYALKFALRKRSGADHRVAPLEGLWWADDMARFDVDDKTDWQWTLMIRQPEAVSAALLGQTVSAVTAKKHVPRAHELRLEQFAEGPAAQVLHVGPFSAEGPTIERLHEFIAAHGLGLAGKHHEIYLTDIRRAAPERWRTIIRQPAARPGCRPDTVLS